MTFYVQMQSIATNLLSEFNQGRLVYVELRSGTGSIDNPGAPTLIEHPFKGVSRGVQFKYVGSSASNGALITAADLQCIMPALPGIVPDPKGFIRSDNAQYKIKAVTAIPASGTPVSYRIIYGN